MAANTLDERVREGISSMRIDFDGIMGAVAFIVFGFIYFLECVPEEHQINLLRAL